MTTIDTVDLRVGRERAAELAACALDWPSWSLTPRQVCDLELLACGAFAPLDTYLGQEDYLSVCRTMRLVDGSLWPMPVTLDIPEQVLSAARRSGALALRDAEGVMLAALHITEAWRAERRDEAAAVFGSVDEAHPGVEQLLRKTYSWYVSGDLEVVQLPDHRDFGGLRLTPVEVRAEFARHGWERIVAFHTRNPMHRGHQELTLRAMRAADARLLIHPAIGPGKPGDVDARTRVRCYQAVLPTYPAGSAMLSLLPLATRMGGPREALLHAIIRRNYGATHFIVGRDHAGPGVDSAGRPFYPPYAAQDLVAAHSEELGLQVMRFRRVVYLADRDEHREEHDVPYGAQVQSISGTELRQLLDQGGELPNWLIVPAAAAELRRSYPPRVQRGFTVFFTGLSGAGKSTIAGRLCEVLRERRGQHVTLLDGDVVRQHLSAGLGFSRIDRDRNVERIGFVAAEITKHRGIAVCAPIAPFDSARREVRRMVEAAGGFVLVYVATPLQECMRRDRKGLYARASAGRVAQFTGITDGYDVPADADVVVDTRTQSADAATRDIVDFLERAGYLPAAASSGPGVPGSPLPARSAPPASQ